MTKSELQQFCRELFYKNPRITIVAETAVGKTKIVTGYGDDEGILQNLNRKKTDATAIVVVPGSKVKKQWEEEIKERGILNTQVLTVQKITRNKKILYTDLLIVDK